MRPVDRVLAALNHEEPDMVPIIEHFTSGEAQDLFVGDRLMGIIDPLERKLFLARWWGNDIISVGGNLPGMLQKTLVTGDDYRIAEQAYGSITYTRSRPYFHKVLYSPVRWPEDLDRIPVPDPEVLRPKIEAIARETKWFKEKGYFLEAFHNGPFVMSWHWLRGLMQFCMDTVRNPSFAKRIVEFGMKPQIEVSKMIIDEAGVHAIRIGNDLGTTRSLLISPKAYRKIIHPWMERLVKTYHRRGVMIFHHCHGNINLIFEEMVDAGFDSIDPLDPYDGIDLTEIKEKYGERITLRGGISKYIGMWSRTEIAQHVADRLRIGAPGGGYILGSAGGLPHDMPEENLHYYRQLVAKARRCYGRFG